ncbi:hypothetical protein DID96_29900 [Burkholderia sp. Bp8963]|uniref:hypothetical protein n=1 Tax=Burkholderia sp. Bp8963 TaxID=2184547 RepID=UPI000F5A462A|nr:hypothetical protein [Burkholderia sp. Bp8963]RQS63490.1 hypothetical protein DID96_29900 [Burkholderia sp. Bp8963]
MFIKLQAQCAIISDDLTVAGFPSMAGEVARLAGIACDQATLAADRRAALLRLEDMTKIRWLGDLNTAHIPYLSNNAWWDKLEQLRQAANGALSTMNEE